MGFNVSILTPSLDHLKPKLSLASPLSQKRYFRVDKRNHNMEMQPSHTSNEYDDSLRCMPSHCELADDDAALTMLHPSTFAILGTGGCAASSSSSPSFPACHYQYQSLNTKRGVPNPTQRKQKRLLLLRHSAQCQTKYCTISHCSKLKNLWVHMERCTNNSCHYSHCFSSRSLLAHFRKCQDDNCQVCVPVRSQVNKVSPVFRPVEAHENFVHHGRYSPPSVMLQPCLTEEAESVSWK
jgi:TAZ zinc finger